MNAPAVALSVRQPWAWLICHAGKDIENRCWPTRFRGRVRIHASKGMTFEEYDDAKITLALSGIEIPSFTVLDRGGIVGEAEIVDCVSSSKSPWFIGPWGFVLRDQKPLPFVPCKGALGFFRPWGLGVAGAQQQGPCREPAIRQLSLMENAERSGSANP